jgi:sec-independent protein translocase protein TatA
MTTGGTRTEVVQSLRSVRSLPATRVNGQDLKELTMGRVGLPEMLVILAIVIIIFGANRLPQLGRGIGSAIKNFKEGIKSEDETADRKS